jgi:CubicO group peptidase (beta-lactamase class C family)
VDFTEDYLDTQGDFARYRAATGWNPPRPEFGDTGLHEFLATMKPGQGRHGERFHYVSPNSDLLGWILERASNSSFADLVSRLLWKPLGAECDAYVTVDAKGAARSAGGICMTLRDLARFGELMRNGGMVDGRQVVVRPWIEDMRQNGNRAAWQKGAMTNLFPHGSYRSKWYATNEPSGAFCAIGIHGQWIYVDPSAEMVIVKQSSLPRPDDINMDTLALAVFRAVADHLAA